MQKAMGILIIGSAQGNKTQRHGKETAVIGDQRKDWDHPDYNIVKIDKNTLKRPCDQNKQVVTQTLVKDHQLKPEWKTPKDHTESGICTT